MPPHGGFCSVNMAAAGLYTFGGSFWEFGEPDWEHTRYFMLFGVAEDHASNPIKTALGKLKAKGVKVVAVNPIRTGYGAIADEWIGIRPGTDGLFVGALIHELMRAQKIDLDYLVRYTNAHWLVIQDPKAAGRRTVRPRRRGQAARLRQDHRHPGRCDAHRHRAGAGRHHSHCADGRIARSELRADRRALPVRRIHAGKCRRENRRAGRHHPAHRAGAGARGLRASRSRSISRGPTGPAAATRRPSGRPVSMHAMRGISAHSNGFQTCRMLHLLQILLGLDRLPRRLPLQGAVSPADAAAEPPGRAAIEPNAAAEGRAARLSAGTGRPAGRRRAGRAQRIDKAYSWDAPLAAHGLMHMVITNAAMADPYPIDVLFMYMANMSWNSSMNIPAVLEAPDREGPGDRRIQDPEDHLFGRLFVRDGRAMPTSILPDTTYLERWDCISLLDRPISEPDGPADAIRQPVVQPDRDVRGFQSVLIDVAARLKLPGFVTEDRRAALSQRLSGLHRACTSARRASARSRGFRGEDGPSYGRGAPNPKQLEAYIANGCFHEHHLAPEQRYYKHANKAYLEWAKDVGFIGAAAPIVFQLYLEAAAEVPAGGRAATARSRRRRPIKRPDREIFRSDPVLVSAVRRRRRRQRRIHDDRPSRSGQCTSITRGARTTPGSARSRRRTAST